MSDELKSENNALRRQLAAERIGRMLAVKPGMETIAEHYLPVACDGVDPADPDALKARAAEIAGRDSAVFAMPENKADRETAARERAAELRRVLR